MIENGKKKITLESYFFNNITTVEAINYMKVNYGTPEFYAKMRGYTRNLIEQKQEIKQQKEQQRPSLEEFLKEPSKDNKALTAVKKIERLTKSNQSVLGKIGEY